MGETSPPKQALDDLLLILLDSLLDSLLDPLLDSLLDSLLDPLLDSLLEPLFHPRINDALSHSYLPGDGVEDPFYLLGPVDPMSNPDIVNFRVQACDKELFAMKSPAQRRRAHPSMPLVTSKESPDSLTKSSFSEKESRLFPG